MYATRGVKTENIFKEKEDTPIHVVLESRIDACQLSSALKTALQYHRGPDNVYTRAIRGLKNIVNELADIRERPPQKRIYHPSFVSCKRCQNYEPY